jgi:hypothetical protein
MGCVHFHFPPAGSDAQSLNGPVGGGCRVAQFSRRFWSSFRCRLTELLRLASFESLIHEKGARNYPLSGAAKDLNRVKLAIRACVEQIFVAITMSMGG